MHPLAVVEVVEGRQHLAVRTRVFSRPLAHGGGGVCGEGHMCQRAGKALPSRWQTVRLPVKLGSLQLSAPLPIKDDEVAGAVLRHEVHRAG